MWILLAFIAVPLIEIGLFIQVGGWIGMWPTLAVVLITAVFGTFMIRSQGKLALSRLQGSIQNLQDPTEPLAHGAMILFAGALLLTPGFFTDAFGFGLLIPQFRSLIYKFARTRIATNTGFTQHQRPDDGIIDAEFSEVPHDNGPSKWTKD